MDSTAFNEEIEAIKDYAAKNDIAEDQLNELFKECLCLLNTKTSLKVKNCLKILKICCIIALILTLGIFVLYNHPKTHGILLRNLQNFIYPGLRILRKVAVPVLTVYPSLTDWYDEWCLVENPYFQVNEMDCWPCHSVNSVADLTGFNITPSFNIGMPFIRNEKVEKVDLNKLLVIYTKYQINVDTNTTNSLINSITEESTNGNEHIKWRINRMEPSREIRRIFPKLVGIPKWWNPSTEKFIFIDKPNASGYQLPNPECANIVVYCTSGERLIDLNPSPECSQNCRKLRILLRKHQTLWYNWWYWRPTSLPSENTTASTITYLTSYC